MTESARRQAVSRSPLRAETWAYSSVSATPRGSIEFTRRKRSAATAGVLASVLIGATLTRLDVPGMDNLLQHWPLFAIAFTAFAVGGVANAINIIDGYNGLAPGYAIVALAALGWVSMQVGDQVVLLASLAMMGAMFGFLLWNWPGGRIFLGDGGAYLLGFWLAELGVLLVVRNPDVSPWFPLVIMAYPIWETLFSMYRRKVLKGVASSQPDGIHMHTLIHRRLVRQMIDETATNRLTARNSMTSPYLWLLCSLSVIPAVLWWHHTAVLTGFLALFMVSYVVLYWRIVRFKVPKWLLPRH